RLDMAAHLGRVVFDPPGRRIQLTMLTLHHRHQLPRRVVDDGAARGGALIDRQHEPVAGPPRRSHRRTRARSAAISPEIADAADRTNSTSPARTTSVLLTRSSAPTTPIAPT